MFAKLKKLFRRDMHVSFQKYERLQGAETYGAASSMSGLHQELRELLGSIQPGRSLIVDRGRRGSMVIGSRQKFYEWVKSDFPDTYNCFFERDGG